MKSVGILRKVCGVDQSLLAARAGVSRKSLNEFERGDAFPVRDTCKRIDDAMAAILEERLFAAMRDLPPPSERLSSPVPATAPSQDQQPPPAEPEAGGIAGAGA